MLMPSSSQPPFAITRASHVVLTVRDLTASRAFYCDVVGLVVSDEDRETVYLRGLEEVCHHSLVLKQSGDRGCERLGLRVHRDEDLEKAHASFLQVGLPAAWADVPFQGRTLHASDPNGLPLELCASMPVKPRLVSDVKSHRGGGALRFDHYQIVTPEVAVGQRFYADLGFRVSDYMIDDGTGELVAVFMSRKNNPHDLVLFRRKGPALHHFGYIVPETSDIFRACDVAGNLGFGAHVERGPGRHGLGHALFVYFRDPDGHRVELLLPPIQLIDLEDQPVRWSAATGLASIAWGLPAQRTWVVESTPFFGVPQREAANASEPMTLERYLAVPVSTES
jgi:catechol 2,3-dioxygenase